VLHSPIPQLTEHRGFGLPHISTIDALTASRSSSVTTFRHGNIDIWVFMMLATHTLRIHSIEMLRQLNIRFNGDYSQYDWREPTYRVSYLVSKLDRKTELDEVVRDLKVNDLDHLRLSETLQLIRAFTQLSLDTQTILDKNRHIQNLGAEKEALTRAVEEKQRRIFNVEAEKKTLERAIADKDRHIANLEAELAAVMQQLGLAAESYAFLEEKQASLQAENTGLAQQLALVNHRMDELLENELTSIRNTVRQQNSRLGAQELFTAQLLSSRTWRTLQAAGKLAKFIIPAKQDPQPQLPNLAEKPQARPAAPIPDQRVATTPARFPTSSEPSPTQELNLTREAANSQPKEFYFVCDEPSGNDKRPRNRTLVVRGWALSEEPLDCVEIEIPSLAPETIPVNTPRPDIKRNFPNLDKNGRSGFSTAIDIKSLPDGQHTLQLRLIGSGKILRQIETDFLVDHTGYASEYEQWIAEFEVPADEVLLLKLDRLEYRPLISILMPVFNTKPDELLAAIDSVVAQSYPNWELCIADDGSNQPEIRPILADFERRYQNIHVHFSEKHGGISAALNAAYRVASGEYVALLDHDDTLSPHALAYVVESINQPSRPDLIYSDEDKLHEHGERYEPFFKPEWSPDLILSRNYVCHLLVIHKDLMDQVGTFCSETDGSQDYDYILRASKYARQIAHIPHVLYHWRAGQNSTASSMESKPYTIEASRRALERFCGEIGNSARIEPARLPGAWRLRYSIPEPSRVSIIIASGGNVEILRANLEGLFMRTEYGDFEVVVMDNSRGEHIQELVNEFARAKRSIRHIDWREKPFNYSEINNVAARECDTPILLFLNDDVSVINSDWLTSMVELIGRREVGAVGAKLLFPDGSIQHAGVVMGLFDNCGHAFYGMDAALPHYFGFTDMIRNVSAVTGACLMTRTDVFWKVGGFDEERLAVAFNDVDLCLKIGASGYRVLFTPFAQLYHHESFSKTQKDLIPHPTEVAIMQSKWRDVIASDPYYSPNLTRRKADYSLPTLWS
jgi:O-antigen biosynthesis protein